MRTASMQFAWLTEEEARAYLLSAAYNRTSENYGDRVAMERLCAEPSEDDRVRIAEARAWNKAMREDDTAAMAAILEDARARMESQRKFAGETPAARVAKANAANRPSRRVA